MRGENNRCEMCFYTFLVLSLPVRVPLFLNEWGGKYTSNLLHILPLTRPSAHQAKFLYIPPALSTSLTHSGQGFTAPFAVVFLVSATSLSLSTFPSPTRPLASCRILAFGTVERA